MDTEGHILTSHHVVEGSDRVIVTLSDGRILPGTVVGSDEETDVAVVRIEANDLPTTAFGDSDALKIGQPVLAIGNPLGLAGGATVTSGVVSSLRRSLQFRGPETLPMIQTDAAVNPGSSGGPLVDLEGRVIGINAVTIPYAQGMSFAVPINRALGIAGELLEHGRVARPWLGIAGYDMSRRLAFHYGLPATPGVFLAEVSPGSPAETAGLRVGDIVISIGGRGIASVPDLLEALREKQVGESIDIGVNRIGQRVALQATLGTRPY